MAIFNSFLLVYQRVNIEILSQGFPSESRIVSVCSEVQKNQQRKMTVSHS